MLKSNNEPHIHHGNFAVFFFFFGGLLNVKFENFVLLKVRDTFDDFRLLSFQRVIP